MQCSSHTMEWLFLAAFSSKVYSEDCGGGGESRRENLHMARQRESVDKVTVTTEE